MICRLCNIVHRYAMEIARGRPAHMTFRTCRSVYCRKERKEVLGNSGAGRTTCLVQISHVPIIASVLLLRTRLL